MKLELPKQKYEPIRCGWEVRFTPPQEIYWYDDWWEEFVVSEYNSYATENREI